MELPATENSASRACKISEQALTALVCVALAGAVVGIYWQITGHDFTSYDDGYYLTNNSYVNRGFTWEGVKWAFTEPSYMWFPISWLSLMLDCELYGLDPAGHHFHNLLLHALNSGLLFLSLRTLTRTGGLQGGINFWACALAAALFAMHPLRVESVAWASERKDMLLGCFWWLTVLCYCRYVQLPGRLRYLAILLMLALAVMSKPMAVTLPCALLLLDYWPLRRIAPENFSKGNRSILWRRLAEKIPMFAIVVSCSIFSYVIASGRGMIQKDSVSTRLANIPVSYIKYLGKTFWPVDLACLYPIYHLEFPWWEVAGAVLLLLGITVFSVWQARFAPYLIVGWLWYLGTLVPVIGLVPVGAQSMADRFTYIPCWGVNVMIAWSLCSIAHRRWFKPVLIPMTAVALIALGSLSHAQAGHWRDSDALYRHTLAVTADNYLIHYALSICLLEKENLEEAAYHLEEAIRINPSYAEAHNNLGNIYTKLGHHRESISHFLRAAECNPDYWKAYYNLGSAYEKLGEYQHAIDAFRRANQIYPRVSGYFRLGVLHSLLFAPREAIEAFTQVVSLKPDHTEAHYCLGVNYLRLGDTESAMDHYRILSTLDPQKADQLLRLIR